MLVAAFIIAVIALIISILAYQRTGGTRELKKTVDTLSSAMETLKDRAGAGLKEQIEALTSVTASLRDKTTDAIDRMEKGLRGKPEKKPRTRKPRRPRRPRAKKE